MSPWRRATVSLTVLAALWASIVVLQGEAVEAEHDQPQPDSEWQQP